MGIDGLLDVLPTVGYFAPARFHKISLSDIENLKDPSKTERTTSVKMFPRVNAHEQGDVDLSAYSFQAVRI